MRTHPTSTHRFGVPTVRLAGLAVLGLITALLVAGAFAGAAFADGSGPVETLSAQVTVNGYTTTTVAFSGSVDPQGVAQTCAFQVGASAADVSSHDDDYDTDSTTADAGSSAELVTVSMSSTYIFQAGQTMYDQLDCDNGQGTDPQSGAIESFTMPPAVSASVGAQTATSSQIDIDTGGYAATFVVDYGTASGALNETATATVESGTSAVATLAGLAPGDSYYYQVVGNGDDGSTVNGAVQPLASLPPAATPTLEPQALSASTDSSGTTATLNAMVSEDLDTLSSDQVTAYIEWGPGASGAYTAQTETQTFDLPDGDAVSEPMQAEISGLTPGASYHFALVESSPAAASATSAPVVFTTLMPSAPTPPVLRPVTSAPSLTTGTTANLGGFVEEDLTTGTGAPNSDTVTAYWQYGVVTGSGDNFGTSTPKQTFVMTRNADGTGESDKAITQTLTGLSPGATYSLRLVETSPLVSSPAYSDAVTFTAPTPVSAPVPDPTPTPTPVSAPVSTGSLTVSGTSTPTITPLTYQVSCKALDKGASVTDVEWKLGKRVVARGCDATVTFPNPGTYHLALSATDSAGRTATAVVPVSVQVKTVSHTDTVPTKVSFVFDSSKATPHGRKLFARLRHQLLHPAAGTKVVDVTINGYASDGVCGKKIAGGRCSQAVWAQTLSGRRAHEVRVALDIPGVHFISRGHGRARTVTPAQLAHMSPSKLASQRKVTITIRSYIKQKVSPIAGTVLGSRL